MKQVYEQMRPQVPYEEILRQREKDGRRFYELFSSCFETVRCPACGEAGRAAFEKYGFHHESCPACGTLFCSPRPDEDALLKYYTEFASPKQWTQLLLRTDVERKALQYEPRVRSIIESLVRIGMSPGGAAVDIGAGSGAFALSLKKSEFFSRVIALDLSPDCVSACERQGLEARIGTLGCEQGSSADFLSMNDLIEHVFDPAALLGECARVLKKSGVLSIATPNGEGFDFRILKKDTRNITPPEHLTYFNRRSIKLLLKRCGFQEFFFATPGKLDVAMIQAEKKKGLDLSERNEFLDLLFKEDEAVLESFQRFLAENRLSSHMLVLARKGA